MTMYLTVPRRRLGRARWVAWKAFGNRTWTRQLQWAWHRDLRRPGAKRATWFEVEL